MLACPCWVIGPFSCPEAMAKGQVKGARFVLTNFIEHMGGLGTAGKAAVLGARWELLGSSFQGRIICIHLPPSLSFNFKILKPMKSIFSFGFCWRWAQTEAWGAHSG